MDAQVTDDSTLTRIRTLCADFLLGNWITQKDSIEVRRLLTGNANRTFVCSLEDEKVIVKLYGSEMIERFAENNDEFKTFEKNNKDSPFIGETGEAVLMQILSEKAMAPKLLGVFNGGRIEEYINGRNLRISDFDDKSLYAVAARKLAVYHSMKPPITHKVRYFDFIMKTIQMYPDPIDYETVPCEHKDDVKQLSEFQFLDEINWLSECRKKLKFPITFCHNDLHFNNIIFRENCDSENRILFVDYECSAYNYRGYDIGYFLNSFEFNVFAGLEHLNFNYTGKKCDPLMKRFFLEEYLAETKKHKKNVDEKDTLEYLQMETEFFTLQAYIVFLTFSKMLLFDTKQKPYDHILPLLNSYKKQKKLFIDEYGQLLMDGNGNFISFIASQELNTKC